MHNRNKAVGVVGTIPRKYEWLYFIKHKSDTSTCTTLEAIGYLVYDHELAIKIKIKSTHLHGLLKRV